MSTTRITGGIEVLHVNLFLLVLNRIISSEFQGDFQKLVLQEKLHNGLKVQFKCEM